MRPSPSVARALAIALLAVVIVGMTGCKWFRKGARGDYAMSPETRPLEVPPDLNLPNTAGAMQIPPVASQARPGAAPSATASATGFTIAGSRDEVFAKVGTALEGIEGLTIATRAQLLGTYDVSYQGSNFLVRVASAGEAQTYVSAVDPRGLPAAGEAPTQLVAALKAALGG